MIDEPLTIPEPQQQQIAAMRSEGWQVIGWVQDKGWQAVINKDNEWCRVLESGEVAPNRKQEQDKSMALTIEYSGMRYVVDVEAVDVAQTQRKKWMKFKRNKRITKHTYTHEND